MTSMAPALPYGIRNIKLTPYTDPAGTVLAGTSIQLPYAQTMKWSDTEDFDTLRGDDKEITKHGKGGSGNWELGAGGLSPEAVTVLSGAPLTSSGTTPARKKTLAKKGTSTPRPWFKVEGQAISDSGGDTHVVLYKCKMTDSLDGEFSDGNFYITAAKGEMIPDATDNLYDLIQNETAVAPV